MVTRTRIFVRFKYTLPVCIMWGRKIIIFKDYGYEISYRVIGSDLDGKEYKHYMKVKFS